MKNTKSTLKEIIKVRVSDGIVLQLKSISDYKIWKAVYPKAHIISYDIQTI